MMMEDGTASMVHRCSLISKTHLVLSAGQTLNALPGAMAPSDKVAPALDYTQEAIRLSSYWRFPDSVPVSATRMARAGFYYSGTGDRVICFSCGGGVEGWEYGDTAMGVHERLYPHCDFVNGRETRNKPRMFPAPVPQAAAAAAALAAGRDYADFLSPAQREKLAKVGFFYTNTRQLGWKQQGDQAPVHPQMAEEQTRLKSFQVWPHRSDLPHLGNIPVPPDTGQLGGKQAPQLGQQGDQAPVHPQMAEEQTWLKSFHQVWPHRCDPPHLARAGFFFAGGEIKCYYCGGGLRDWDPGDDPWKEHAKRFPRCGFLLQQRGEDYVRGVQAGLTTKQQQHVQPQPTRYGWAEDMRTFPPDTGQLGGKQAPLLGQHGDQAPVHPQQTRLESFPFQMFPHLCDPPHLGNIPTPVPPDIGQLGGKQAPQLGQHGDQAPVHPQQTRLESFPFQMFPHLCDPPHLGNIPTLVLPDIGQLGGKQAPQLGQHDTLPPARAGFFYADRTRALRPDTLTMCPLTPQRRSSGDATSFEDSLNDRMCKMCMEVQIHAVFIICGHLAVSVGNYSFDCTMQMWGSIKCTDVTVAGFGP